MRRRLKRLLGERAAASRLLNLRPLAHRVEYWAAGSHLETMLIHYQLAARHFPTNYLDLLKLRMPAYVKVALANPFPRTFVTTRLGGGKGFYYGPFRNRAAAELFESNVLELFQIRRCQEDLVPSPDHPGCIYGEMNKCMRPCQQLVSVAEYRGEVDRAVAFLETGGRSLIEPLEAARESLSLELRFEDAAREHRQIDRIQEILRPRDELVSDIDRLNGIAVTPSAELGAVELWLVLAGCSPEAMAGRVAGYRAEGYRRFQLKVGGDPDVDIERIAPLPPCSNRAIASWPMPTPAGSCTRRAASYGPSATWTSTSSSPA